MKDYMKIRAAFAAFVVAIIASIVMTGCKSIKFEKIEHTPSIVGTNVVATSVKEVRGEYYAYGIENNLEGLNITASPTSGVTVAISRVSYDMSKQHGEIVDKSLSGAANLAAKIGAAIASCGASPSADAVSALVARFVAAGGNPEKATVECADGSCTISDGEVMCTDGSCTPN